MKFLRTIRLDASDDEVYDPPATAGEWAVPGSFAFLDDTPESLTGKRLQAFRSGFLGTQSFGWSSLVEIAEIDEDDYQQVVDRLARHFIERYGAPHIAAALPVAGEEADYASTICEYDLHTILTVEREFGPEGLEERLKVVRPRGDDHAKVKLWGPNND